MVDLFGTNIDAMKKNENAAKNFESCSVEICRCVQLVTATAETVDASEKKEVKLVTDGFARLEAHVVSSLTEDISLGKIGCKQSCGQVR